MYYQYSCQESPENKALTVLEDVDGFFGYQQEFLLKVGQHLFRLSKK
jgi:hypothetical protein